MAVILVILRLRTMIGRWIKGCSISLINIFSNVYSIDHKDYLCIYSLQENKLIEEKELPTMGSVFLKYQYPYALVVTNEEELLNI